MKNAKFAARRGRMLITSAAGRFRQKKPEEIHKIRPFVLVKSACKRRGIRYLCFMQNADTQTVPLAEYQKVVEEMQELKQRLAWFERMMYGQKSERFVPKEPPAGQLSMDFDPALGQAVQEAVTKLIAAHERKVAPPMENAHKGRLPIPDNLPRVVDVIPPDEDVSGMKHIGDDVTEVLEFEAGRIWVRRIIRPRYARPETQEETGQAQIVQAPAKELPFGRSKAGVSLVSHPNT